MGWSGGRKGKREVIISELKDMLKKENYWSIFGFCFFFKKKKGAVQFLCSYTSVGLCRDTKTQLVNSLQHKQLVREMSELSEITFTLKDALTETNIEGEKEKN